MHVRHVLAFQPAANEQNGVQLVLRIAASLMQEATAHPQCECILQKAKEESVDLAPAQKVSMLPDGIEGTIDGGTYSLRGAETLPTSSAATVQAEEFGKKFEQKGYLPLYVLAANRVIGLLVLE